MSQYIKQGPPPINTPPIPTARPTRHGLALPTLILGIIGLVFFPLAFLALLLGVFCLIGVSKSQGRKTGKGLAITGCLLAVISLSLTFFVINSIPKSDPLPTGQSVTPEATLAIAEANIVSSSDGVAYSNSAEGLVLAEQFSKFFKEFAQEATDSLSERHEFVTHCQLHEDSVAFIVHVPKLRKFDDESKEQFVKTAWILAGVVLSDSEVVPLGTDLAVGVKGNILYQNIYFGELELPSEDEPIGVQSRGKNKDRLSAFFKGVPSSESTIEEEVSAESEETSTDIETTEQTQL